MSTLKVDNIANTAGVTNNRVLQIQHVRNETPSSQSITAGSDVYIPDLEIDITPASSNSTFLLLAQWSGECGDTNVPYNSGLYFRRSGTALRPSGVGNRGSMIAPLATNFHLNSSSTLESANAMYLDSPSTTSQITYTVNFENIYTNTTLFTNRTEDDTDGTPYERSVSTFLVMEIAG
jgi:hypothetical protein